jgi:hypothetical protein
VSKRPELREGATDDVLEPSGYWTHRRLSKIPHWGWTSMFSVRAEKAYVETGFVRGTQMASSTSRCSISIHALFAAAGSAAWSRCASSIAASRLSLQRPELLKGAQHRNWGSMKSWALG